MRRAGGGGRVIEQIARSTPDFSNEFGHLLMAGNAHPKICKILLREPLSATLLLGTDDPDHARFRALMNAVFAMGRRAKLAPVIESLTDELIDQFIEQAHCDFVNQFPVLLPTYIIADILGLPRDKYDLVKRWSDAVITVVGRTGTQQDEIDGGHEIVAFRRYLRETEVTVAGAETTRNTLMSGLVQLLRHKDQMQVLIDDPTLISNAVDETLRYETPASSMWRIAKRDVTIGGAAIPQGGTLLLRYGPPQWQAGVTAGRRRDRTGWRGSIAKASTWISGALCRSMRPC